MIGMFRQRNQSTLEQHVELSAVLESDNVSKTAGVEQMPNQALQEVKMNGWSIVRAGVVIEGEFVSPDDIVVEGTINGHVRANNITVAAGATILGTVDAAVVTVDGQVKGEVHCTRLQVNTGGCVEGKIVHAILVVEPGASIEATIHRRAQSDVVRNGEIVDILTPAVLALQAQR